MSGHGSSSTDSGALDVVLQNVLDQFRGAWRFRWLALGVSAVLAVVAWIGIFLIPNSYEAEARVFVDTKTTLSEVTKGISVESNVEGQLMRVRQALLGAPQLNKVAAESDLMLKAKTPREQQEVIEALRKNIGIEAMGERGAGVYTITYQNADRAIALKVVDRLLNTFVEGALGGKREGSETATRFLREQIAEYEKRLTEAEQRLAEFKKNNVGMMPGSQGDYFQRMQAQQEQLQKLQSTLAIYEKRREALGAQLRGEQPFITAPGAGGLGGAAPMAADNDTASRIRETRAKLDDMLLRYTDSHPDVIALRDTLAELEKRQTDEIAAARRGDSGAAARTGLAANPVYQNLQVAYNQSGVEVAAIQAEIGATQRRIAELNSRVDTAPNVEAEFARLNRDYDVTRAQYQQLLTRLEQARVSDDAEQTGVVRFEVIDPPIAKFDPVAPNRPLLIIGALVAALGAGAGVAYLLQLLNPVVTSARNLSNATGLPVLGEVSMTWLDRYRAEYRKGIMVFAGATGGLVLVGVLVLLVQARVAEMLRGILA
jgi:polysaccharide chain length determinant protein (PEP-CTERM system associated)